MMKFFAVPLWWRSYHGLIYHSSPTALLRYVSQNLYYGGNPGPNRSANLMNKKIKEREKRKEGRKTERIKGRKVME
jgi:hypothetical protein